jgi:2'-5' RNA ligase
MRLFVAAVPSAEAVQDLAAVVAPLRDDRSLRWSEVAAWHLTLAFYGEVDEAALGELDERVAEVARRHRPADVHLDGAGRFGGDVLWVGLRGDVARLRPLAADLSAAGPSADAEPPKRFRPHLTLARSRSGADLRPYVSRLAGYAGPPWRIDDIVLFRSHPSAAGDRSRHEPLRRYPLTGLRAPSQGRR